MSGAGREAAAGAGAAADTGAGAAAGTGTGARRERDLPLPARMGRFLEERFPLHLHGISIALFFITNASVAQASTAETPVVFSPRDLLAALALALMFLRLRLFDEVKDYEHDCRLNPRRPLPRGLLSVREVNAWAGLSAAVEAALAAALGWGAFTGYLAVLAFTLLMRVEFFARRLIRPRLFTYALLHTPSGGLIGLFVFSAVTGRPVWEATRPMWFYAAAGWSLLMVFEVARKTFDPRTEPSPDTYSTVFGPKVASLMNGFFVLASTVLIMLAVLDALDFPAQRMALLLWGLTAVVLSVVMRYALAPSRMTAAHVRAAAQAYIVFASLFAACQIMITRGVAFRAGFGG